MTTPVSMFSEVVGDQECESSRRAACPFWKSWIGSRRTISELRQGVCVAVKVVTASLSGAVSQHVGLST